MSCILICSQGCRSAHRGVRSVDRCVRFVHRVAAPTTDTKLVRKAFERQRWEWLGTQEPCQRRVWASLLSLCNHPTVRREILVKRIVLFRFDLRCGPKNCRRENLATISEQHCTEWLFVGRGNGLRISTCFMLIANQESDKVGATNIREKQKS